MLWSPSWGCLEAILGPSWGHLGPHSIHLGDILGSSWGTWGPSCAILESSWPSWGHLGAISEPFWFDLGNRRAILGPFWDCLEASLGFVRVKLRGGMYENINCPNRRAPDRESPAGMTQATSGQFCVFVGQWARAPDRASPAGTIHFWHRGLTPGDHCYAHRASTRGMQC
jgi:hypothetical protein